MLEVSIRDVLSVDDLRFVRDLIGEYVAEQQERLRAAGAVLERPDATSTAKRGAARDLDDLPGPYAPPEGCLLLALVSEQSAGCVALKRVDAPRCEMKRLFVRPPFRRQEVARQLVRAAVEKAQLLGYEELYLDTIAALEPAPALYRSLGFRSIEPFDPPPSWLKGGMLAFGLSVRGKTPDAEISRLSGDPELSS